MSDTMPGADRPLRHAALVFGGFTLLFAWVFARSLVDGTYLAETDLFDIFLPIFLSPRTVWSSFEFAGMPTFADPENMEFYPLHLFFSQVTGSWTAFVMSAYVLGACFMYAYVYFHTRSAPAAALAGIVYGLSEAMLERLPHPVIVHALAWLPLIVLSLDRVREGRHRWLWVSVGAFAAANSVLAGHPQIPVYIAYVCGAYVLVTAAVDRPGFRYLAAVAVMALTAGLLTAIMVLPVAEASLLMARQGVNFEEFVEYSNSVPQMLSILFPTIEQIGRETPTYVGLAALALAPVGAWQARSNWRAAFWLLVVVVALFLGVGAATPLAQLVFELPLQQKFRIVARHLVFAAFGFAVLAGFGLAAVRQRKLSGAALARSTAALLLVVVAGGLFLAYRPDAVNFQRVNEALSLPLWNSGIWMQMLFVAGVAAVCFAISRRPQSHGWVVALLVLVVVDLVHAQPYRPTVAGLGFETVPAHAVEPSVHTQRLARGLEPLHQRLLSPAGAHTNDVLPTVFARAWQIPSAGGYTSMMLQGIADLALMRGTGVVNRRILAEEDAALDLLAIKYVVLKADEMTPEEEAYAAGTDRWREADRFRSSRVTDRGADEDTPGEAEYVVLENRRALPRAWLAREVMAATDGAVADALRTGTLRDERPFVPAEMVLVDEGTAEPRVYPSGDSRVNVQSVGDGAVDVRVSSASGGFLVLSEAHYPGWHARIDDGDWQPVHRTYRALQGIDVPPGDHLVAFELTSASRRLGAGLTVLGLVLIALMAIAGGGVRRRAGAASADLGAAPERVASAIPDRAVR